MKTPIFAIVIGIATPFCVIGFLLFRLWLNGDSAPEKGDGDLSDPKDVTITKLHLDDQ